MNGFVDIQVYIFIPGEDLSLSVAQQLALRGLSLLVHSVWSLYIGLLLEWDARVYRCL